MAFESFTFLPNKKVNNKVIVSGIPTCVKKLNEMTTDFPSLNQIQLTSTSESLTL